jgi:molybdopterin-guanine dinucleotide biosynthesis protein A
MTGVAMHIDTPEPQPRILGAVLAGGQSRRFGSDKALADLDGRTLIDRAIAELSACVDMVAVCGREVEGLLSLPDRPRPDMGPLGGLNAALHHAASHGFAGVLSTGCDMPVFPRELAAALIGEGAAIMEGQQLLGYWPSRLASALDTHLAVGTDRSIRAWLAVVQPRSVALDISLPNINTPADLDTLARISNEFPQRRPDRQ